MQKLFERIFKRIFLKLPSHLILFEIFSLYFRFRKVEKEIQKLQVDLWLYNQHKNDPRIRELENRLFRLSQTIERGNDLAEPKKDEVVDPLIAPLCNLFNELGYFTIASCSGHVSVTKKEGSCHSPKENWYILFTTKSELKVFFLAIDELKKNGLELQLTRFQKDEDDFPVPVYRLSSSLRESFGNYNDKLLFEFNKNVYKVFKAQIEAQNREFDELQNQVLLEAVY